MISPGDPQTLLGRLGNITAILALLFTSLVPVHLLMGGFWAGGPGGSALFPAGILLLSLGVGVYMSRIRFSHLLGFAIFLWGGWMTGQFYLLAAAVVIAVILRVESEMRSLVTSGRLSQSGGLDAFRIMCLHFMALVLVTPLIVSMRDSVIPFVPNLVPLAAGMMLIVVGVLLAVAYALIRLGSIPRELRTPTKLRRIDRRGMTLIEILIVIAILSILIAGLVQAVGLATLSGGKTLDAHAATTHARTTIAELRHGIRPLPSEPVRLDTQPGDLPSTLTLRRTPNTTTATAILEYRIGAGAAREVVQFEAVISLPQGGDL